MKLGILTSIETRHRFFVQALAKQFNVVAVGYEKPGYQPANLSNDSLTASERRVVEEHFAERARQEERFFAATSDFLLDSATRSIRHLSPESLNGEPTATWLQDAGVEVVAIYGTDLIRPPLLDAWSGRMVNLHLGLSPYYRGTATNFYPLLNGEPEFVGATIHLIDAGIDSGGILAHVRPDITADDMPHTIGCKAIRAGVEKLIQTLPEWWQGRRTPVPQWREANARLYLRKHYHPRHVVELYQRLEAGLIPSYANRAEEAKPSIRLVE